MSGATGQKLSRRAFLRRGAWGTSSLFGGGALLSTFGERNWPRVYRVTVPIPGLPAPLAGLRICQLSDLHRGFLVSEDYLRRAVALAKALPADLTVVTGDFITDSARYAASAAAVVSELRSPLGVYGVLGNHDYWNEDPGQVIARLRGSSMRLLINQSVRLRTRGVDWWLCGADDGWSGAPDLDRTVQDVPESAFKVLLWHEPDLADRTAPYRFALQLSGHTHGGQCLLPNGRPMVTPRYGNKYVAGLRRADQTGAWVYTNVGLGVLWPPIRLNCAPEITLLTLAPA